MKQIKMKDIILSHYQKVHELEMDGFTVRVFKPRTMQQLPSHKMLYWIKSRAEEAIHYMKTEVKADWQLGNPDYGLWDAQTVYHYDPRHMAFNIYIAAILVRPFSREAYECYCTTHAFITDVNQRLMLMWDSREYDRIGGYDQSYGAYKNQKEADAIMYTVKDEKADIMDMSPDFYRDTPAEHDGLVVKLRDVDDSIDIEASWPKAKLKDYVPFVRDQLADCMKTFDEFHKHHPDFHEMHFLTERTTWEKDSEEDNVTADER